MGIEVANLVARIQMVAEGTPDVIRQAETIRTKLVELGESGAAAANQISENQIKAATALGRYERAVTLAAQAQTTLDSAVAKAGIGAEEAQAKVAELTTEIEKLNAAATAGGTIGAADLARIKTLERELTGYQSVTKAADADALARHRVLSAGERLVVSNRRLGDGVNDTGKRFRILTTEVTGFLSAIRNGEIGSTLLARALIRIADAAKVAGGSMTKAFLIGGAITAILAALTFVVLAVKNIGQAIAQSHIPQLSDDLADVAASAGIAGSALRGVALETNNIFRSLDLANAEELTDVVARLADQLRFLTPDANLEKTIRAITQGVSTGNLDQVAKEFGLSAARLKEALGDTEGLSAVEITVRAINALLQETPQHMERINEAIAAQETGWAALGARISNFWDGVGQAAAGAVDIGAHVFEALTSAWDEGSRASLRMREAESNLNKTLAAGGDVATELLNSYSHLNETGALTAARMARLSAVSGLTSERLAEVAAAAELAGIKLPTEALEEFIGEFEDIPPAVQTAKEAIASFYQQVSDSNSVVNSIKGLAVAWHDMTAELTPGSALNAFQQLDSVIQMVVTNGIGSLEMLRLQAKALGDVGFASPEQVAAAMEAYDLIERALTPIATEAERVRQKLTGSLTSGFQTTQGAVDSATGSVNTYTSALNNIPKSVTTDVILNYASFGMVGGGVGGGGGRATPGRFTQAREAGAAATRAAGVDPGRGGRDIRGSGINSAEASAAREARRGERLERANQNFTKDLAAIFDGLGLGGAGGGGGGGGDSLGATIEQIRALIQAVNNAILIGQRGGVAIGMTGNSIPSIAGTFVGAQGGALQLNVNSLVIRGVWDFADPAAKETVINELQALLSELTARG